MESAVNDQEILELKKLLEKKKRSRNCFISSSSLPKEDLKLNQFLDGENTTVYALVEVSKDSEKPAKREKIPLTNKDFLQLMQKFMVSKKEKTERKIVKPSKWKRVAESPSVSTNISKEEKNIQNDELACHSLGFSDQTIVIYKRSNHSGIERLRNRERDRSCRRTYPSDRSEIEHSHLKILYNRNVLNQEPRVKRERIGSVTRGTNTDVVQTPKVLEEALEALTLNFDPQKDCDKPKSNEGKIFCFQGGGKDLCKATPPSAQSFLLVPFIINNSQVPAFRKSNSHDSFKSEEQKCQNNMEIISYKGDRSQEPNDGIKCLPDKQSEVNIDHVFNTTFEEFKTYHTFKKELIDEKKEDQHKTNDHAGLKLDGGICLLKEVKTLQHRLNAIVEGLETKAFTCLHVQYKKNGNSLLNGTSNMEDEDDHHEHPDDINENYELLTKEPPVYFKECGVQAMIVTSYSDKTVTVPSGTVLYKSLTNRLVQFPSEANMETPVKPSSFNRLIPCKSIPLFQTKVKCKHVGIKRASSMLTCRERIKEAEYLRWMNLDLNYEGSLPDDQDQFDEDLQLDTDTKKSKDRPHRSEKSTNILFKKNNSTLSTGIEKDKLVMVKQCAKIAKIKIIGNTILTDGNQDSDVRNIKLELNELGSIKLSNKFNKKTKTIINNDSICNNSNNNNSSNTYSKIAISNESNNVKEVEHNKKVIGNGKTETLSKIGRKETVQIKMSEVVKTIGGSPKTSAKDTTSDSPQRGPRALKLKKRSTPLRMFTRGMEDGSNTIKSPRIPSPTVQVVRDDVQVMKSPRSAKNTEKKINSSRSLIPKKQLSSVVPLSGSDDNTGIPVLEQKNGKSREVPAKTVEEAAKVHKQSPPVKSIWALTKVVLYEDGTQTFEVLEASSYPLKYQLNMKKSNNGDTTPIESTMNMKTNNSDCNNIIPNEKSD